MRVLIAVGKAGETSIPTEWAVAMQGRGHTVEVVPVRGARRFLARFATAVRTFRPDVVHAHHTMPAAAAALQGASLRSRTVLTLHRIFSDASLAQRAVLGTACTRVAAVVANSEATAASVPALVRRFGGTTRVIYNGVDLTRLDAARDSRASGRGERVELLTVGRLIADKAHDQLLRAFAELRQRGARPARLTIVGDGPERARLEMLVNELDLGSVVEMTGHVAREEVYARLWSADAFVMPSRTEGFCNAVVEAMAARLPVIVTPAGALPEVVGDAGMIATGWNAPALAAALQPVLAQPEAYADLASRAERRARERFTLTRTLDQYEDLYRALASGAPARASG